LALTGLSFRQPIIMQEDRHAGYPAGTRGPTAAHGPRDQSKVDPARATRQIEIAPDRRTTATGQRMTNGHLFVDLKARPVFGSRHAADADL
jgi:hypothetical protein